MTRTEAKAHPPPPATGKGQNTKGPRGLGATQNKLKAILYASLLVYMFSMCCLAVLIHFAGTETYLNTKSFDSACAFKSKALHVCVRYEVSVKVSY